MATFAFYINAAPADRATHLHAFQLAKTLVDAGHTLRLLFVAGSAVGIALRSCDVAADEWDPAAAWATLNCGDKIVCSSAAMRHGVNGDTCHAAFRIGGLGEWVTTSTAVDKVVQWT